ITGGTTAADDGPTGLPTLTGIYATYSYPPPTVPPTKNAPFMQRSNLPDGTVFIAVGAILGAFGSAVMLWRAPVAFLLHPSLRRPNSARHSPHKAASHFPAPPAPFYKYGHRESSAGTLGGMGASLGGGGGGGGGPASRDPAPAGGASAGRKKRGPTP